MLRESRVGGVPRQRRPALPTNHKGYRPIATCSDSVSSRCFAELNGCSTLWKKGHRFKPASRFIWSTSIGFELPRAVVMRPLRYLWKEWVAPDTHHEQKDRNRPAHKQLVPREEHTSGSNHTPFMSSDVQKRIILRSS